MRDEIEGSWRIVMFSSQDARAAKERLPTEYFAAFTCCAVYIVNSYVGAFLVLYTANQSAGYF